MKKIYSFVFLLYTSFVFSQNFADTKGELQISASGTATYTLPIATPPSIKGVAPVINLNYSSGMRGGIAGQGWSINSISTISRIATRRDIDGFIDGVDFDADDKLALDGQRLLIKTGTYWAAGSTYETEYKSNTKIELKVEGTTTYFIVTTPDGSKSWYGSKGLGNLQHSVSVNSWYIVRYEDVNGNFIDYNYSNVAYNSTNQLYIDNIVFSGNTKAGIGTQNKISFFYKAAARIERDYLKGQAVYATQLLDNIKVYTNNAVFRTYKLTHEDDAGLGYQRVKEIQEINAQNEPSSPVVFEYNKTETTTTRKVNHYANTLEFEKIDAAGDFDGDGRLDFAVDNKLFTKLFDDSGEKTPITMPFRAFHGNTLVATTLTNNKVNQASTMVNAWAELNSVNFDYYKLEGNTVSLAYTKSVPIVNDGVYNSKFCATGNGDEIGSTWEKTGEVNHYNEYIEGDFNGDGISDVIISKFQQVNHYSMDGPCFNSKGEALDCNCVNDRMTVDSFSMGSYFLSLDANGSTVLNTKDFVFFDENEFRYFKDHETRFVGDFNGDGKTDILFFDNHRKDYHIVSFRQLTTAPWMKVEIIGSGTIASFSTTKQILLGDYNGDGKIDLMMPTSEGGRDEREWNIFYSNPNPAGGEFFTKEILNFEEYWPNTGDAYKTQTHYSNFYTADINGDGKSDVVRVWREHFKVNGKLNNHDSRWAVHGYTNNIGKVGASGFVQTYDSSTFRTGSPVLAIPIVSNYKYAGANTEVILVRAHNSQIEYYQFNKNVDDENRLKSVTESNGNIKQTIDYLPMEAANGGLGSAATDFYSSANGVTYPNIEIIRNTESYLVSKLTATINGVSKYQDFRYRGYVSNLNYGTVGFTRTTRSSWYLTPSDTKIWTTAHNDTAFRGANTISWTSTNASTVFDTTPTGLLSTKTNVFSTYTNPTSKQYNVLLNTQTTLDALSGVKSEKTYTYDGVVSSTDYYGLQTKSVSKQYSGTTLQGSVIIDNEYNSNPTGTGSAYYIGRPKKVNTSANNIASGDIRTSEENYTYSGSNLTKTEKKGHNTFAIVEDMTYDAVGNLLTKTVSAPAAVPVPAARMIQDDYDATKRFVVKKTDHQKFVTNFAYNTLGQVIKSTDHMGVVSDFIYDNWGKLTNSTVTGSSAVPITTAIVYEKFSNGGYSTITTNNLEAKTVRQYDVLGREVLSSTKGFAMNTMVSKRIIYDGLGRKQRESEPYFSTPNLWTNYEYDYLLRPTKVTLPTGKIQTLSYSVLTTTSNDDGKITTATIDALGNKVQSTDPGGTINFAYFANGQLKESDYQGNKVKINIDGWGNKVRMEDPSAGIYTYSYDAFGQLKTESTPNGTTSLVYDAAGKPTEKTIVGTKTNSKTTYAYNALNQITSSTYLDNTEAKTTTSTYEYDALKRLFKTTETTPYAIFVKQLSFDALGRVDKETSAATAAGKTSVKTIKNTYQNGFPWQIVDDNTQQVLWQSNTLNERGQLLTAALGNGIAITNTYDQYGYATQIRHDKTSPTVQNILTLNTAFEIKRGNLNSRNSNLFSRNEIFKYDTLDRLTEYTNALGIQETQVYDDKGRITQNAVGTYGYDTAKTYQNKTITPTPEATGYYAGREGIFNDSFEDRTGWGVERYPITGFYSYDNTTARTGKNSVKLVNAAAAKQFLFLDKWVDIDNAVPTQYTYSAWVYSDNPQSEIFLYMKDGTNAVTQVSTVNNIKGAWTQIVGTFLVPANVKKLRLRLDNNGIGNVWYDDVQIRKTSDAATAARALNVTYNTFKSPVEIEETGVDKISFTYNDGNDRSSMFYGGLQTDKLLRTYRKHYSADGTMEVKQNMATGAIEFVTYIGGDGYTAPIVLKSDGTTQNYLYLHRDYQGTIVAVTNQTGALVEKRLFDAWGNIVKVQDGAGNILAGLTVLDRGYTGHEHLQSVGIIHMNGRLYDPKLHRFLQPDNYIQEPDNTQNYNKYGYVLNNPLKYTDPSGEEAVSAAAFGIAVGIGALVAGLTYTLTALWSDVPFNIGGLAKATFIGAASAAVTFGIGAGTSTITSFYSKVAVGALMHGSFQGFIAGVQGGNFVSAFTQAAAASIAASLWTGGLDLDAKGNPLKDTGMKGIGGKFANSGAGTIAFGTVAGGATAAITKDNIWQGAIRGMIVSGLNHAMHGGFDKKYKFNVMLDEDGARGAGHHAISGELDNGKYRFISLNGTLDPNDANYSGESHYTDEVFDSMNDIQEYYGTKITHGHSFNKMDTYLMTRSQMNRAFATGKSVAKQSYHLLTNSCTNVVTQSLAAAFGWSFLSGTTPLVNHVNQRLNHYEHYFYSTSK